MRLYTLVALCVCARRTPAPPPYPLSEKKIDALDNVDLDDVEPELIDQPSVQDLDNSLRKVSDIPVKVIDAPVVVDENSNEYIPDKDENIIIKRVEIDLNNPGLPQRQEHETQNPENYGDKERAVYKILQKAKEAQSTFAKGIKGVTDSFYNLNKHSDEITVVLENVRKLNESFSNEILELNNTIRTYLEPKSAQVDEEQKNLKLKYVDSKLENLQSNFKQGVDVLNEGFELLSILQEEDEAALSETKTLVKDGDESIKDSAASPAPSSSTVAPGPQLPAAFGNFVNYFQTSVNNMISNVTSMFQNTIGGGASAQKPQAPPPGAQSDEAGSAPAASSTPKPSQWSPQVLLQQWQTSFQNIVNSGQGNQQSQAPGQSAPTGPIQQALQNILQVISRPGQAFFPQPANNNPQQNPASSTVPPKKPESSPSTQADPIPAAASVPVAAPVPAEPQQAQVAQPAQPAAAAAAQPVAVQQAPAQEQQQQPQGGPIQQLVQNNPIYKGIQNVVQRIQGNPNSDTPRTDVIEDDNKEKEDLENKGHGGSNANQGSVDDSGRLDEKIEQSEVPAVLAEEEIEDAIKPEVESIAEKTE